jgi:hypothetical protein
MADSIVGRLIYKITGDVSDIKKSLTNTEKQIKKFTRFVQSAAGLFGAAAAFKMLANVVKSFVNEALESEQAELKLASAMKISGQSAAGQVKQLTGLAKALSLVTTYTDEETVAAMTLLTETGNVSAKGMRELIPLVQDMATGLGMDLNSAATAVSKALAGNATGLNRLGVQFKSSKDPVQQFNNIVKALTENFGGMSEAMAKSAGGGLKQITMQFDELKEAVGTRLLQAFKGTISALSSRIKADVVLGMSVSDIGSPEEAKAYLKTLQTELVRVSEAAKIARLAQAGLGRSMVTSNAVMTDQDKRAADLQNKITALTRFMTNWKDVEASMPPVLASTTRSIEEQAKAAKTARDEAAAVTDMILWQLDQETASYQEAEAARIASEEAQQEAHDQAVEHTLENLAEEEEAYRKAADKRKHIEEEAADQIQQIREDTFYFAMDLLSSLGDLQQAKLNHDLAELTAKQKAELASFKGTEAQKLALQEDFEQEKAKLEYDAALKSWRLQLAAAIVSGAKAILSGFQTQPFIPAGILAGAMATVLAGVQLAAIRQAKPVPSFSTGADFTVPAGYPNDSFRMNAETGEHVHIDPAGGGGEPIHVVVNLDGRPILNTVARASRDRRLLIDARSVV